MRIKDIPEYQDKKNNLLVIEPSAPASDAVLKMEEYNFGAIIVVQDNRIVGMFTERDVLRKIVAQRRNIDECKVADIMTTAVKVAREDDTISDLMRRMTQGKFRHFPVVDGQGRVLNMLSQGDLVSYSWPHVTRIFQRSFAVNTQIWVMFTSIILYTIIMMFIFKAN